MSCQLPRQLLFCPLRNPPAQPYTRRHSRKGCDECAGQCPVHFRDRCMLFVSGCNKIYRDRIKNRLRTAHQNRCQKSLMGIGSKFLINIKQQTGGCRGGNHFDQRKRHQHRREIRLLRYRCDPGGKHFHKPRRPQDPDRHHQTDQRWQNLKYYLEAVLCTLDKSSENIGVAAQSVAHNIKYHDGYHEIR